MLHGSSYAMLYRNLSAIFPTPRKVRGWSKHRSSQDSSRRRIKIRNTGNLNFKKTCNVTCVSQYSVDVNTFSIIMSSADSCIWLRLSVLLDACNGSKEASRIAFRKACEEIPSKVPALKNWSDNGTETEVSGFVRCSNFLKKPLPYWDNKWINKLYDNWYLAMCKETSWNHGMQNCPVIQSW